MIGRFVLGKMYRLAPLFVVFSLAFGDSILKLLVLLGLILWIIGLARERKWRAGLRNRYVLAVVGFFILLFLFGVVLPGDFYDNQKYFFYFYITYLAVFLVGASAVDEAMVEWILNSMFLILFGVSLHALVKAIPLAQIGYWDGRFGYYNQLGMFVSAMLSGIYLAMLNRRWNWWKAVVFMVGMLVLVGSYSRGAWCAFGLTVLFGMVRSFLKERRLSSEGLLVLFFLGVLLAGFYGVSSQIHTRLQKLSQMDLAGRPQIWGLAIEKIRFRPLGNGIVEGQEGEYVHQQLLAIAVMAGVPTAVYFLWFNLWILFRFRDRWRDPSYGVVVAMLLHNLVENSLLGIWDNSLLYWFFLGVLVRDGVEVRNEKDIRSIHSKE